MKQENASSPNVELAATGDEIWELAVPHGVMGIQLGKRLNIVRLPGGQLWIHSSLPPTAGLVQALGELGTVRYIVGPNTYHDAFLAEFAAAYPRAELHTAPGLADLNRKLHPTFELDDAAPEAWRDVIDQHWVRGVPRLNEFVFLHRPSRSLIIADLAFNLRAPQPWLTRVAMSLNHAYDRFTPTRFFKSLIRDPKALRSSIEHLLEWDFDRIVVGHGANVETRAKETLRDAFAFLG